MRAFLIVAVALTGMSLGVAGCSDLGVGRVCLNPIDDNTKVTGTELSAPGHPALECRSRVCLLQPRSDPMTPASYCTARCNTNDDCTGALLGDPKAGQCNSKFVCAVATKTGNFACQTVCMCQDDVDKMVNGDFTVPAGYGCPQSCAGACITASQ